MERHPNAHPTGSSAQASQSPEDSGDWETFANRSRKPRRRGNAQNLDSRGVNAALSIRQNNKPLDRRGLRARNARRFSEDTASPPREGAVRPEATTGGSQSHRVTQIAAGESVADDSSRNVERLRPGAIGLGRATGTARVPDLELSRSPTLVVSLLQGLIKRVQNLEENQRYLVGGGEVIREDGCASDATLEEWESILAQYRQLTMAVTASSSNAMRRLGIPVYEGAADACILGGNLSFYISCQTRLLQDLYNEQQLSSHVLSRRSEFMSYSLLYFGVFHVDYCELARLMRSVSKDLSLNPPVKLALSAVNAVHSHNGIQFLRIYKKSNIRQRTLMNPKLSSMRATALAELICAYRVLEKSIALSLLGLSVESEFLLLLKMQNPALAEQNCSSASEFRFRLPVA